MRAGELLSDGSTMPLDVPWMTGPGAVSQPQVAQTRDDFRVIGGKGADGKAHSEVFRYAFNVDRFVTESRITDDPDDGGFPAVWGAGASDGNEPRLTFFGGWSQGGGHTPPRLWELEKVTTVDLRWKMYSASTSSPVPAPRSGAVIAAETCAAVSIFGGLDESSSHGTWTGARRTAMNARGHL